MNKEKIEFDSVKYRLDDCIDIGLLNRNSNVYFMHKVNNDIKIERFIIAVNDFDNKTFNIIPVSEIDNDKNFYTKIILSVKDMLDNKNIFINLKNVDDYLESYSNNSNCLDGFSTSDFDRAIYLTNKSALILYNSDDESDLFDSIYIRLFINDLILKNLIEESLNCLDLNGQNVKYDVDNSTMNYLAPDLSIDIESIIRSSLSKFKNLLSEKIKDENLIQEATKEYNEIYNNMTFYKISFE